MERRQGQPETKVSQREREGYHCEPGTLDMTLDMEKSNVYFLGFICHSVFMVCFKKKKKCFSKLLLTISDALGG